MISFVQADLPTKVGIGRIWGRTFKIERVIKQKWS